MKHIVEYTTQIIHIATSGSRSFYEEITYTQYSR